MKKKYIVIYHNDKEARSVTTRLFRLESGRLREAGCMESVTTFKAPEGLTPELEERIKSAMLHNARLECSGRWDHFEPEIVQAVRF